MLDTVNFVLAVLGITFLFLNLSIEFFARDPADGVAGDTIFVLAVGMVLVGLVLPVTTVIAYLR